MNNIFLHIPPGWTRDNVSKIGEIDYTKEVHIYVDQMPNDPIGDNIFRIIAILEPFESLKNSMLEYFNTHKDCYSYIFTYHQDILDTFENSIVSVTPTTWVRGYEPSVKEFNVSSVFGNKHLSEYLPGLEGYAVRWELFTRREEININKKFYLSSSSPISEVNYGDHLVLGDTKTPMFDSQFHIAIENTNKISNAFSEKLIDCFQTRTIPIYYGPSNIGDFFNSDGMFIAKSAPEIIEICNGLNENTYNSMLEAVEENYQLSMNYRSLDETMVLNVKKALGIKI